MRSSFDILSALFRLVNVPQVKDNISGKVQIGNPSLTSQEDSVSVNLLSNPNRYMQSGFCNLNIHVPESNHLSRLRVLTNILIPIVKDAKITTDDGDFFFQIDDDKGVIEDPRDGMVTYNIKLTFQTL